MQAPTLGHVHLKVRDLDRATTFYTDLLGLTVTERVGNQYAFLTGNDVRHTVALQAVGADAPQPPSGSVGLYHVAFEVPSETALADAFAALTDADVEVQPVDHGISWVLYFDDPAGNTVELYCDRRAAAEGRATWGGRSTSLSAATLRAHTSD
jgi:catechol 2,3-dioxygenase